MSGLTGRGVGSRMAVDRAWAGAGSDGPMMRGGGATDGTAGTPIPHPPTLLPLLAGRRGYPLLLGLALLLYVYSHAPIAHPSGLGLYLTNVLFFDGASVGAGLVAALAYALGSKRLQPLARVAEVAAVSCLGLTTIFVGLDVVQHRPSWSLVRATSAGFFPLRDAVIVAIYLESMVALGYVASRADAIRRAAALPRVDPLRYVLLFGRTALATSTPARESRMLLQLTKVFVPMALLLHSIPAVVVGHPEADGGWLTVVIGSLFIVPTAVFGLAVVIVAATSSRICRDVGVGEDLIGDLAGILLVVIAPHGYCLLTEMQASMLTHQPNASHIFHAMVAGPYAPFYWFVVVGGVIVPFLLLWSPRTSVIGTTRLAALLVVLGVLTERWTLVILPRLDQAPLPHAGGGYGGAGAEIVLTLAAYGLGALTYCLLVRSIGVAGEAARAQSPSRT